jgi:hypothetical protein
VAGDTLFARGGTYTGQTSVVWHSPSGTQAAPITWRNYPGETPIFDGQNAASSFMQIIATDWLIFDGITVQNYKGCCAAFWVGYSGSGTDYATNNIFRNNTIKNIGDLTDQYQGTNTHGFYISYGNQNVTINNNTIIGASGAGIQFYHTPGTVGAKVYNNVIDGKGAAAWGIVVRSSSNIEIYNNTVVGTNPNTIDRGADIDYAGSTTVTVKNNIVSMGFLGSGATCDHNMFINGAAANCGTNNVTASSGGFVNASTADYHLTSASVAIDKGTTVPYATTDRDVISRPQGAAYDIGAYEYKAATSTLTATLTSAPIPAPTPTPAPTPSSTNYYVSPSGSDSNSGSASAPWATIQHAASIAKAGDTVHVATGNYAAVSTTISGTATARIRFISDVQWGAKIRTTGAEYMWLNSANYIDIMGFDVSGDGRIGILNNGSFVRIIGNHVHNITATCGSNGGAGIDNANYQASDDDVIGNVVHDIGQSFVAGQGFTVKCGAVQGIYHANLRGHIMNNIVYRAWAYGIHLWHAPKNVAIANNLVFQNGEAGILIGAPSGGTDVASGMVVVNNIIMDNPASTWGGGQAITEDALTGTDNKYINNLIWNNKLGIELNNGLVDVGTVNADPLMVNFKLDGTGDYHLQSGSRAINSGTSTAAPSLDLDGVPRPFGSGFDLGVYEFGGTPQPWPWM